MNAPTPVRCYVITGTVDGLLPLQRCYRLTRALRVRCGLPVIHTLADLRGSFGTLRERLLAGEFRTLRYVQPKRVGASAPFTYYVPWDPIVEAAHADCLALGVLGGGFATALPLQDIDGAVFAAAADEPDEV